MELKHTLAHAECVSDSAVPFTFTYWLQREFETKTNFLHQVVSIRQGSQCVT